MNIVIVGGGNVGYYLTRSLIEDKHDIKVIEGEKGYFIAMPSRKASDGEFRDIAHPIKSSTREKIQEMILDKYRTEIENAEE